METKSSDFFSSWHFSHCTNHSEIIIWEKFPLSSGLRLFSAAKCISSRQITFGATIGSWCKDHLMTANISIPSLLLEPKLLKQWVTHEISLVQGQVQPNGSVTSRCFPSLSTKVKVSAEALPVVGLYVRTLPILHPLTEQQSRSNFSCKGRGKKLNLPEGVWKKPSPPSSCLLSQSVGTVFPLKWFSVKFSWNQPTGWKVTGIHTFITQQRCLKLTSRGRQEANNVNLASSFSTQIAKLIALESAAFLLLLLCITGRSCSALAVMPQTAFETNKFHKETHYSPYSLKLHFIVRHPQCNTSLLKAQCLPAPVCLFSPSPFSSHTLAPVPTLLPALVALFFCEPILLVKMRVNWII